MKLILTTLILLPFFAIGQPQSQIKTIDSIVSVIEKDPTIIKKVYDTVTYEKVDGGTSWDSAFYHREFFYKDRQIVKVIGWNSYGNWRNDMLAYYQDGKPIRFSKGESFKEVPGYGRLEFQIYYHQDKDIQVTWLIPKPENVLGVATDVFLIRAYDLLKE